MQHAALSEAEQLIQSWLHGEREQTLYPSAQPGANLLGSHRAGSPPLLHLASTISPELPSSYWSGMKTSALSSQSVPLLTSHDFDTLDRQDSNLRHDTLTALLPSSGLLSSSADLPFSVHWWDSNSKSDTHTSNRSFSTRRHKSKQHSHLPSDHLFSSSGRHDSYDVRHHAMEGGGEGEGEEEDLLSRQDWGEGEVGENVHSIVQALMKKTVSSAGEGGGSRERPGDNEAGKRRRGHHDPRVTMDMRHKQVHERRRARDEAKQRSLKQRQNRKEAWREAERLVREGEREEGRRRRREEAHVAEQMAAIRRQVQEETERKRRNRSVGVVSVKPRPPPLPDACEREAVMVCAGECVRGEKWERRRRENRAELVRQLEEMELSERKERSKVLRQAVSVWYGMVAERQAKLRRAVAWWAWHMLVRVWGVWRRYVRGRRERREQDRMARELQREKRLVSLASRHYQHRLLRRCVCVWVVEAGRERGRMEREEDGRRHRERVQSFLAAAAATSSGTVGREEEEKGAEFRSSPATREVKRKDGSVRSSARGSPQPILWQTARKHVDELLSSVSQPDVNEGEELQRTGHTPKKEELQRTGHTPQGEELQGTGHTPRRADDQEHDSVRDRPERGRERDGQGGGGEEAKEEEKMRMSDGLRGKRGDGRKEVGGGKKERENEAGKPITCVPPAVWPSHPQPKPSTKPVPMSGMQARSVAIAERRERRQERERARAREREEKARKEEDERRQKERQEKEAIAAQRREERRLAKQREVEKMERQRREKEQAAMAEAHYTAALLRGRGLAPWKLFVGRMKEQRKRAEQFHLQWRLQSALGRWREVVAGRQGQREQAADGLCHRMLKRRVWQRWREYVQHCRCVEEACEGWARELLARAVLRAWVRGTAEARREGWEREKRAKMHHTRQLKRAVLSSWQRYVPLSREEREREVRRAGLRRKVTQWLPNYQPRDFDQDQEEHS